jgi:autotransporter-associated beta strand protein
MVRLKAGLWAVAVSAVAFCGSLRAQTTWIVSGGNTWNGGLTNWSALPSFNGTDDLAFQLNLIGTGTEITSTVDAAYSIDSITISGTGTAGTSLFLDSTGGGSLTITTSLIDESANAVTISVPITGSANVASSGGGVLTLSGNNTYTGVTTISNGGTLVLGSSSTGIGASVSESPVGLSMLTLEAGTTLTTADSSTYFLGNNICLPGDGTVDLLSSGPGTTLELDGTITGTSGLSIVAAACGTNTVRFGSATSTFGGGVSVAEGDTNIVIGASSTLCGDTVMEGPLGTGSVMLSSGNNFTTTGSGCFEIDNAITLCSGGTVTLLGGSMGSSLTLTGMITGNSQLEIAAPGCSGTSTVTLTSGCSTFCGGVTVDAVSSGATNLVIGASTTMCGNTVMQGPLGTGQLTLGDGVNFTTKDSNSYSIGNSISLSGGGSGWVTLLGGSSGTSLSLTGMITGGSGLEVAAPGDCNWNTLTLTSGCSTFCGGVSVDEGNINLVVGSSSTLCGDTVMEGPLGTGTLMLSDGNNLTTTSNNSFEIDNAITLCDGGTVTLLSGSMGGGLTLTGMITGSAQLEIISSACGSGNTVEFTSGCSTFCGGVEVDAGNSTLVVGASTTMCGNTVMQGPLGTGQLTLGDGVNFTTKDSNSYSIGNSISLSGGGSGWVTLLGGSSGGNLSLTGMITGGSGLEIAAPGDCNWNTLTLTSGCSTFCGGVSVDEGNINLVVGSSSTLCGDTVMEGPLGKGTLMLSDGNNFTTTSNNSFEIDNAITLCDGGTVTLLSGSMGGGLTLTGMITGSTQLEISSSACGSGNTVEFTSGCTTFCGGVEVDAGNSTLVVGASTTMCGDTVMEGPLGTGQLTLGDGTNFTTADTNAYTIGNSISLSGGGSGWVTILGGSSGGNLSLTGMITGGSGLEIAAPGDCNWNTLTLTSGCSTFCGGVSVDEGNINLVVGSSSTLCGDTVMEGPLGKGTLMLSDGNNFTTTGSGCFEIDNAIALCGGGTVTLLGGGLGTSLTLTGMITGASELDIAAPGCTGGPNTVTLTSGCSTFCGGVTVEAGATTLVVGASASGSAGDVSSGPLGTGTLVMGNGTALTTPAGTPITVLNNIEIGLGGCSTVTMGGSGSGLLTLMGTISDYCAPGALVIDGPVEIEGCNTYSGGTTVNDTTVQVDTNSGLGTGALTASSSTVTFTSCAPTVYDLSMCNTTINFASGSTPTIVDMTSDTPCSNNAIYLGDGSSGCTILTFQVGSDPQFYGAISGTGSIATATETGGELQLFGNNSYTGGTTVNSSTVLIASSNSALGTGPVTVNFGGAFAIDNGVTITNQVTLNDGSGLGGYGTLAPAATETLAIQNGSGITGGRGTIGGGSGDPAHPIIGTLTLGTNATLSLGAGGGLQFSIMNAVGTPGTDYSAIAVQGTLDFSPTLSIPSSFDIQLLGVDSTGQVIGTANTFDPSQSYSWTLITFSSQTGTFNPSAFSVDTSSYFYNSTAGGQFFVTDTGNSLVLNFSPVPEPSTWALMGLGVAALAWAGWRKRRVAAR